MLDAVAAGSVPGNQKRAIRFANVGTDEAENVRRRTGFDVAGYSHSIDSFAIRKILKDH